MSRPVEETATRLAGVNPLLGFDVGRPSDSDWLTLDGMVANGTIGELVDAIVAANTEGEHPRDAAGVSLATQLSSLVIRPTVAAYLLEQRGLAVAPDTLALHRTTAGAFDRLALADPRCAVLAGDSAADHPDAEVLADRAALRRWVAERLAMTLAPALTEIRKAASYGLRGLWGNVADGIGTWALMAARERGSSPEDLEATWQAVEGLIDEIATRIPQLKSRPRPFRVRTDEHATMYQVRCTCCLLYKVPGRAIDDDGRPRYCTTCPLIDDERRTERIVSHLVAS